MYVSHIHSESSSCRPYCLGIGYLPLLGLQHSVGQLCRLQFNVWVLQRLQIAMLAYALLLRLCSATAATLMLLLRILFADVGFESFGNIITSLSSCSFFFA